MGARGWHEKHKVNFECHFCGKASSSLSYLRNHIQRLHNGTQEVHECNLCGKNYTDAGGLKTHINSVHDVKKDYICELCEKSFNTRDRLKKHVKELLKRPFWAIIVEKYIGICYISALHL